MKTKLAVLLASATLAAFAGGETNSPAAAVSELAAAVEASGWTVQELVSALGLMEAKYNREVATKKGREDWHGRLVSTRVDTNTLTRVSVYEDGTTFTDEAKVTTPAASVKAANLKLPRPVYTNGIPARLAAARIRQRKNASTVSNVTVTVTAGFDK